MKRELNEFIQDKKYDYIFTHGSEYEPPHTNHREVKIIIKELKSKILEKDGNIFNFAYEALYGGGIASVASLNADYYVQLDYSELKQKIKLIDIFTKYEWAKEDLKNLAWPCPNPEAFNADDIFDPPPHEIFKKRN